MKSVEEYVESYRVVLQQSIPDEQVWGLGLLSTVGSTSRIIGYAYKPRSRGIKLKKRIAEWTRHAVHVQIAAPQKARGFPHVIFGFPDGSRIELEIPQSFGQYSRMNNSFYVALGFVPPT